MLVAGRYKAGGLGPTGQAGWVRKAYKAVWQGDKMFPLKLQIFLPRPLTELTRYDKADWPGPYAGYGDHLAVEKSRLMWPVCWTPKSDLYRATK